MYHAQVMNEDEKDIYFDGVEPQSGDYEVIEVSRSQLNKQVRKYFHFERRVNLNLKLAENVLVFHRSVFCLIALLL